MRGSAIAWPGSRRPNTNPNRRGGYVGRVYLGHRKRDWVGRFDTKRERNAAVARARVELSRRREVSELTCGDWVDRFLARYEREHKDSSLEIAHVRLGRFKADFGDRRLDSVTRPEAIDWAERVPPYVVPMVVTLMSAAVDAELIERNPFTKLSHRSRSRGRADEPPPTPEQLARLLEACSVHGWYAPR